MSNEVVIAFKGFDRNLKCRGFQFAVGQTYTHDGDVKVCESGFHACTNPLDVWTYYGPAESRFVVVEVSGEIARHDEDSKVCAASLHVKAELTLPEFIESAVQFAMETCKGKNSKETVSEERRAQLAASGDYAQLAASGDYAQLAASGNYAKLAASGDCAQLAASGDGAQLAASGDYAKLAASGDGAQLAASGNYAKLAASGYDAKLAASGDGAQLAASGNSAQLAATGDHAVIVSSSHRSVAKGKAGTWIALAEFDTNGKCIGFSTGKVGEDGIPADTWLCAKGGKLVESGRE